MRKNRCFICILIFSFWFMVTGFQQPSQEYLIQPPSAEASFGKIFPLNEVHDVTATSLTLQWSALEGDNDQVTYRYCLQKQNQCPDGMWVTAVSDTLATVTNLTPNTIFFWWVRAYDNNNQLIASADEGTAWTFTTMDLPGQFNKLSPVDLSTDQPSNNLLLSWGTSQHADYYEYCLDTTDNGACNTSWIKSPGTSVTIPMLSTNAVYYWEVRAVNGGGNRYANEVSWWQFTTHILPDIFMKLSPQNTATDQPANGMMLSWKISSVATSYQYCLTLTNAPCAMTDRKDVGNKTSISVDPLMDGQTYYWQVWAVNAGGNIPADGGTLWQFTTKVPPLYLPIIFR